MQIEKKVRDSKDTVGAFSALKTKNIRIRKSGRQAQECSGDFKKFCKPKGTKIYSTMSDSMIPVAHRRVPSLKKILYRILEIYAYKYLLKLPQFVAIMNSRRDCSIDLMPKDVKNSLNLSLLYSWPL